MSNKSLEKNYISTPFEYTKYSRNLTLLQQSVLIKVSEHLQDYVRKFYGSDLKNSREVPRPLFSDQDKASGIPPIVVSYSELGVSANNYPVAHEAVKEILALTIDGLGKDNEGNESVIKYNIFTKANMSSEMTNGVALSLNMDLVDQVFDMSKGYVRHPVDIARIAMVERMPMMYYYLQKYSDRWQKSEVDLKVTQIKTYLGLIKQVEVEVVDAETGESHKEMQTQISYPKFSKFNQHVLKKSIDDINRLRKEGMINVCVRYEPIYNGKRKVGNPSFIRFYIYDTLEEMQRASEPTPQPSLFDDIRPGAEEWKSFLHSYNGVLHDLLQQMPFSGLNGNMIVLLVKPDHEHQFNEQAKDKAVASEILKAIAQAYGKRMTIGFKSL